jgi:hypothetical protein
MCKKSIVVCFLYLEEKKIRHKNSAMRLLFLEKNVFLN